MDSRLRGNDRGGLVLFSFKYIILHSQFHYHSIVIFLHLLFSFNHHFLLPVIPAQAGIHSLARIDSWPLRHDRELRFKTIFTV